MKNLSDLLSFKPFGLLCLGLFGGACASTPTPYPTAPHAAGSHMVESAQNDQCNDWEIYFATSSSEISTETRGVLTRLARCIRRGDVRYVAVTGSADPRGGSVDNHELGHRRADAIRSVLLAEGCDPTVVHTSSEGETNTSGTPENFPAERRASIRTMERAN